jgi:regulator of sigma D
MRPVALEFRHAPGFHLFGRPGANQIDGQARWLGRPKPPLIVRWLDDERRSVVKGFEDLVGIGGDNAEALEDDLLVLFVSLW